MPTVKHSKEYTKTLKKDSYVITVVCSTPNCSLREIAPTWKHCPYCGEEIIISEVEESVEEG